MALIQEYRKNRIWIHTVLALLAAGLVFCGSAAAALVPANSPRVKTMGRWIPDDNGNLYAGRGAVIASVEFEGTGVQAQMFSDSQGDVWWLKKLDDGPMTRFKPQMGLNILYQGLPYGKHTLTMIRETEGMRGVTILCGFNVAGEKEPEAEGTAQSARKKEPAANETETAADRNEKATGKKGKAKNETGTAADKNVKAAGKTDTKHGDTPLVEVPRRRSIEIIGDSVAAGAFIYPDGDYFERESGYLAFGPRLARMLDADWSCVASSGEGAVRNNEEKYPYTAKHAEAQIEQAFYTQMEPRWDNRMDAPDLVILAYGENDFNDIVNSPSDVYFKKQYKNLLLKLRKFRPDSVIFCTTPANIVTSRRATPGMSGAVEELRAEGDTKIYFIDLNEQGQLLDRSDFLDGVHPLASGHEKIARYLLEQVRTILGWN